MKKALLLFAIALMAASVEAQSVRRGDANNDKKVDSQDVTEVSSAIIGKQLRTGGQERCALLIAHGS